MIGGYQLKFKFSITEIQDIWIDDLDIEIYTRLIITNKLTVTGHKIYL